MTRDQFEHALWRGLRDLRAERQPHARHVLETWLRAADAYANQGDTPQRQAERRARLEEALRGGAERGLYGVPGALQ